MASQTSNPMASQASNSSEEFAKAIENLDELTEGLYRGYAHGPETRRELDESANPDPVAPPEAATSSGDSGVPQEHRVVPSPQQMAAPPTFDDAQANLEGPSTSRPPRTPPRTRGKHPLTEEEALPSSKKSKFAHVKFLFKLLVSDEDQNERKVAINEVDEALQKELSESFDRTRALERFDRTLKKELVGACNPLRCAGRNASTFDDGVNYACKSCRNMDRGCFRTTVPDENSQAEVIFLPLSSQHRVPGATFNQIGYWFN